MGPNAKYWLLVIGYMGWTKILISQWLLLCFPKQIGPIEKYWLLVIGYLRWTEILISQWSLL